MKKSLFLVGGLLSTLSALAQSTPVSQTPQNKNAVIEELTGIHCGYCPDGHKRANDIAVANPGRVVLVNVHAGGYATPSAGEPDFRTTDGTALDGFFSPSGYPAGAVSRQAFGSETVLATGRGNWNGQVTSRLAEASPVNVAMDATIDAATRVVTLHVEIFYTTPYASGTTQYLNVGILQNNVEGPQSNYGNYNPTAILPNGNYMHQHIFRGFINAGGTWGEAIDASSTGVITKTITYTLPAQVGNVDLNIGNLQFFALVHEGHNALTNSKVITAAEIDPTLTNVPAATAGASAITNTLLTCDGGTVTPIVKISNSGDVINSIDFSYSVGGGAASTYTYNGTISAFGTADITLPAIVANQGGSNNCVVTITSVNGGSGSISTASITAPVSYAANTANSAQGVVETVTDRYGSETSWKLYNSANTVVAQAGPYTDASANGTYPQANVNFTINPNECYKLVVADAYGDGFDSGYGDGSVTVKAGTTTVAAVTSFPSGKEKQDAFASSASVGINEATEAIAMTVFPVPATDAVTVAFEAQGGNYTVNITDLAGRTLATQVVSNAKGAASVSFNTADLAAGNYMVTISNGVASYTQQIVKK